MRSSVFWRVMPGRLVVTDVSGQPIGSILKGQAIPEDCLTLEDGTDRLFRNVGSYQSTLRNMPEKGRSHFHRSKSLMYVQILTESGLSRMSLPAVFSRSLRMLVAVPDCLLATKWTAVCILGCKMKGCSRQTSLVASHIRSGNMQMC
jgi:hypothetical protein